MLPTNTDVIVTVSDDVSFYGTVVGYGQKFTFGGTPIAMYLVEMPAPEYVGERGFTTSILVVHPDAVKPFIR